jgi:hypothetical protein
MRWNWKYAFISLVILVLEICIALFVHDRFIRPFFGDVLAVSVGLHQFANHFKSQGTLRFNGRLHFCLFVRVSAIPTNRQIVWFGRL